MSFEVEMSRLQDWVLETPSLSLCCQTPCKTLCNLLVCTFTYCIAVHRWCICMCDSERNVLLFSGINNTAVILQQQDIVSITCVKSGSTVLIWTLMNGLSLCCSWKDGWHMPLPSISLSCTFESMEQWPGIAPPCVGSQQSCKWQSCWCITSRQSLVLHFAKLLSHLDWDLQNQSFYKSVGHQ